MKYTVLSLFPEIPDAFFSTSIMAKAITRGLIEYRSINIRDYALDKHHSCDDAPYGGGPGMLMLPEVLGRALEAAGVQNRKSCTAENPEIDKNLTEQKKKVIYLTPSGKPFAQKMAKELSAKDELILLCGRYEGIDQRIIEAYIDEEISVGDYVLSSGEAAALILIDATYRLIDDVIKKESLEEESFSGGLLEYPQYTHPEIYATMKVPEVLLSGHHENIRLWRRKKQLEKTLAVRPDLVKRGFEQGLFDAETCKIIDELRSIKICSAEEEI